MSARPLPLPWAVLSPHGLCAFYPAGPSGRHRPAWQARRRRRWPPSAACCSGGGRPMLPCRTRRRGRTAAAGRGRHVPRSCGDPPTSSTITTWTILSSLTVPPTCLRPRPAAVAASANVGACPARRLLRACDQSRLLPVPIAAGSEPGSEALSHEDFCAACGTDQGEERGACCAPCSAAGLARLTCASACAPAPCPVR